MAPPSRAGAGPAALAAPRAGGAAPAPLIVPQPVSVTTGPGRFTLTPKTRIVAAGGSGVAPVARDLAGYLRPGTGFRPPVGSSPSGPGAITGRLSRAAAVPGDRTTRATA